MKRIPHKSIAIALFAGALWIGCYAPTPSHPEYIDRVCGSSCDRRVACEQGYDRTSCLNRCRNFGPPRRIYYRADVIAGEASCFSKLECNVAMDDQASQKLCVTDLARSQQTTDVVVGYCLAFAKKTADCGRAEPMDGCVERVQSYTDEVIHELSDCLTHTCAHYRRCDGAVVGFDVGEDPAVGGGRRGR